MGFKSNGQGLSGSVNQMGRLINEPGNKKGGDGEFSFTENACKELQFLFIREQLYKRLSGADIGLHIHRDASVFHGRHPQSRSVIVADGHQPVRDVKNVAPEFIRRMVSADNAWKGLRSES